MRYTQGLSRKLNALLKKNVNTEKGYLNAAKYVVNPSLKDFFNERAKERNEFAEALRNEIYNYGQKPVESGRIESTINRNWMNFKVFLLNNNDEAIFKEAMRGEEASLKDYNKILKDKSLPMYIDSVLLKQRNDIQDVVCANQLEKKLAF